MGRKDDPDLAPDAALAEDLGDEEERKAEQLTYFGGEKDDIDDFDPAGLDDGSDPNYVAPEKDDEKEEEEVDDKDDSGESDAGESESESESESEEEDAGEEKGGKDEAESSDEEADADDAGENADDADQKSAPKGIPKHRFDEVNERRKAAETELEALKAQNTATEEGEAEVYDFDLAETEYMDLLLDGKTVDALAKRKEIRAAEKADFRADTTETVEGRRNQADTAAELGTLSAEAEKMFPVFDQNSEDFDPAMTRKVMVYYRGYVESGEAENPGDAFVMALSDVIVQYGLKEIGAAEGDAEDDVEPKPKGKKTDVPAKLAAAKNAHKPVAGEGLASDAAGAVVPDIENMTDEELDALPEKTLARLRGDFVD